MFASLAAPAAELSPRQQYEALLALRTDPASVYTINPANRIEFRRAEIQFSLEEGKLAFFRALDSRITGAVFSGRGHILAAPRGVIEKQQMARFLGAPILDQDFVNLCLRFTDDTAAELARELAAAKVYPEQDSAYANLWDPVLAEANLGQSLRILFDELAPNPLPYFYAGMQGTTSGPFDIFIDPRREETVLIGQPKKSGTRTFYDVWASYKVPDAPPAPAGLRALQYKIDTSLLPNNSLEGKTEIRLRAETDGQRTVVLQLSRMLAVDAVTGDRDEPLTYFQNEGVTPQSRSTRGNDYLYVVLPAPVRRGAELTLHFRYKGNVIEDAGNGVLFVGSRESWYPHVGDAADFADYDLTMRWPRHLRLVATGTKIEEHDDGDFRVGHWRTEQPMSTAGFNVGDYIVTSLASGSPSLELYANRNLEQSLDARLNSQTMDPTVSLRSPFGGENPATPNMMSLPPPAARPAAALKQLGRDIDSSIHFFETYSGPFPFKQLSVSQIPGTFGQGWPGLLYLSTFSFLAADAQQRAGLSASAQEHFTELVPFHEVAHQWWGNLVGWSSYRDQWIDESIANYLALLFADQQKGDHSIRIWLDRYRRSLVEKSPNATELNSDIGALELGSRLTSSKSPAGFEDVIYGKGSWVIHMLREMLRQPGARNSDARFIALLNTLSTKYAHRALSTGDFQREVEAVMTPAMDLEGGRSMEYFFEQWVRGTGVPRYHVEFSIHSGENGLVVRGKLRQLDVPRSFVAPVPLYASSGNGHLVSLGSVIAAGPETSFHFSVAAAPRKIVIDPQMTLLCVPD